MRMPSLQLPALLVVSLAACNGGEIGSSSSSAVSSQASRQEVSQIPWSLASQEGIWRVTYEGYSAALSGGFLSEGQVVLDAYSRGVSTQALEQISATEVRELNCYEAESCTLTQAAFEQRTELLELNDSDGDEPLCMQAIVEHYYTMGEQAYQVEVFCDADKIASVTFERIAADPYLVQGQVAFNAAGYPPADTNMGVSGYLSRSQIEFSEGELTGFAFFESVQALIPYGDDVLEVNVNAVGSSSNRDFRAFTTGQVLQFAEQAVMLDSASMLLNVQVSSEALGDPLQAGNFLFIHTGTAEVISADDNAISLTINGTAIDGEAVTLAIELDFND